MQTNELTVRAHFTFLSNPTAATIETIAARIFLSDKHKITATMQKYAAAGAIGFDICIFISTLLYTTPLI